MEPDGQTDPVRVRSIFEKRSSDVDATGLFFYRIETTFLSDKKRSARIALRRRILQDIKRENFP